jgi:hypothetical protein
MNLDPDKILLPDVIVGVEFDNFYQLKNFDIFDESQDFFRKVIHVFWG